MPESLNDKIEAMERQIGELDGVLRLIHLDLLTLTREMTIRLDRLEVDVKALALGTVMSPKTTNNHG